MSADDLNRNNKETSKPKNNYKIFPQNKLIFVILGIGLVAGIGGISGYLYFEDQQNQLQSKLDAEHKKAQQLEDQKKQEELKAQQVQTQLQQQAQQKQAELDQKQQELQQQQALAKGQQDIAQFKQQQLQQSLAEQQAQAQQQAQQQQAQLQQQQQQAQAQLQSQQAQANLETEKQQILSASQYSLLIKGEISGHINFYIPPVPSFASSDVQGYIDNAASRLDGFVWYGVTLHRVYDPSQADLIIQWVKNFGLEMNGQKYYGIIQLGLGWDGCYGSWEPYDGYTMQQIFWHEMGHAIGFNHSTDPNNIMYQGGVPTKFSIDYDNFVQITNGYSWTMQVCGSGPHQFQVTSSKYPTYPFDFYVMTPTATPSSVLTGTSNTYYPSCSQQNIGGFTTTCNIPQGAKIMINNPYKLTGGDIGVIVKIIDLNPDKQMNEQWDMNFFQFTSTYLAHVWQLFHNS